MSPKSLFAAAIATVALTAGPALAAPSSATILATQTGPSTYHYDLKLTDDAASTAPIGTFWYAWIPGQNYMGTSPTNITSPAGWTEIITHAGATDGYAIQWKNTSTTNAVQPGQTLAGFSYDSADPPSVEFGNSPFYPSTPTLTSFTYSGNAPFAGTSQQFVVTAVPEPVLAGLALPGLLLLRRRSRATQ